MLRIAAKTRWTPEEAIHKVVKFFGPDGYKLNIVSQTDTSACFEGGGGSLEVKAVDEDGKTSLEFLSVEWDYQVKEFIRSMR